MDWHIELLNLKGTHPLCNVVVESTTVGVKMPCESV